MPLATRTRRHAGFTLIETLMALGITGVLSSIAYPSLADQVQRSHRSDAWVAVVQVQMAEERWRSNAPSYGSLADLGLAAVSPARHYGLAIDAGAGDAYRLTVSAAGSQTRDATCRVLQLDVAGARTQYASGPDASLGNDAATNRRCWGL